MKPMIMLLTTECIQLQHGIAIIVSKSVFVRSSVANQNGFTRVNRNLSNNHLSCLQKDLLNKTQLSFNSNNL